MTSPFNPFINPSTGLTPVPAGSSPFPLPSFPSPFPVFGSQPLGQSPLAQSGGLGAGTAAGAGPSTNAGLGLGQTPFLGSTPNAVQTNGQSPFPVFNIQPAAESTSPFTFMANAAGAGTPSGGILATGTPGTGPGGGLNVASGSRLPSLAWNNAASRRMAPPASSTGAGSTRAGVEDMMRGLGEAEKMMERAIVVATEIQRLEGSTFEDNQGKEKSEGMELGPSGLPKLEELVFECEFCAYSSLSCDQD
ncbi:hypothetical protein BD324DRAFT_500195 [Kockovaella imperatae]|uniref:Uncharacterized protein n=1 Tax=Kockovaella imperatae TaxID=4999 RepID=A0A1Y1UEJ4_9TREE|nr:hypothetical protein BD324DRAFT_500195 [Kockovaella imperatae]ORX36480.1 hypothetical protein BD324DRAFT_500195 [Kockovaella imperatae]